MKNARLSSARLWVSADLKLRHETRNLEACPLNACSQSRPFSTPACPSHCNHAYAIPKCRASAQPGRQSNVLLPLDGRRRSLTFAHGESFSCQLHLSGAEQRYKVSILQAQIAYRHHATIRQGADTTRSIPIPSAVLWKPSPAVLVLLDRLP